MNKTKTFIGAAIAATMLVTALACQKADNKNAADNKSVSNTNQNVNAATPPPVALSPPAADSPSAAYKAAYTARKNKDVPALKKLLSKDMIGFFEMLATADEKKKSTVDEMLMELCESPQGDSADVRNEKIDGDKATAEYKDEKGEWKTMDFIKEDGSWKLTMAKADNKGKKN